MLRGGLALSAAALTTGFWHSDTVQIRRETLFLPNWDADGFRIILMSDLHVNSPAQLSRAEEALNLAYATPADAMVIAGDFMDTYTPHSRANLGRIGQSLYNSRCPVLGVFGNHDQPNRDLREALNHAPITLLQNQSLDVQGVSFVGLDDAICGTPTPKILHPGDHSKSLICVWHEPDTVDRLADHVSLQVSGHSHGGEICLPGGIPIYTHDLARKYTGGFYPKAKVPLYVSKGVATVGPFRLYCPPEISLLTLKRLT